MRLALILSFAVGCGARSVRDGIGSDIGLDSDADSDSDTGSGTGSGSGGDELDLGPDARPSDYPDADDWTDADPSAIEGDPCCELVGEPTQVDDAATHSRPGLVEWNGDGWAVLWTSSWYGPDGELLFQALDPDGQRIGSTAATATGDHSYAADIEWGSDRYGVTVYTPRGEMNAVAMLGADGADLTGWTMLGADATQPFLARYRHGAGWVVTYEHELEGSESAIEVVWVGDDGAIDGEPKALGTSLSAGARVAGLASRAAAVWPADRGIHMRTFSWPDVESEPPEFEILSVPTTADTSPEIVAYRDYAVVAIADADDATVVVVDPWENEIVAGPNAVASTDGTDGVGTIRLASAEDKGYLGACWLSAYPSLEGEEGEISFGLVGPDATSWGLPVVVTREANVGGCSVGWNGEEFLVLFWRHREDSSVWVQRIRPRL